MKKIALLLAFLASNFFLPAQATLVDTFAFEWTNNFNSFWGITDVDGQLHLGSDGSGDIYVIDDEAQIISTIDTDAAIDFNHGMVWDGATYWVAEDFTSSGASLYRLAPNGMVLSSFVLPPQIGGNASGVGGLTLDGNDIWFSIYYPDFDQFPFGYAYKINTTFQEVVDTIPLYGQQVYGIASRGDYIFYVTDDLDGDEERIYAYNKIQNDTLFSFPLLDPDGDSSPRGLHWFDDHLWLLAKRPGNSAFAYSMLYKYQIDLPSPTVPEMELSFFAMDFGDVPVGQTLDLHFHIKNTGTAPLQITSVTSSNPVFVPTGFPLTPFFISPNDSVEVTVTFAPTAEEDFNGTIDVNSNAFSDPNQDVLAGGTGVMMVSNTNLAEENITLRVYPNPVQHILQVHYQAPFSTPLEILLYDEEGKLLRQLYQSTEGVSQKQFTFDFHDLPSGHYFLTVQNNQEVLKTAPIWKAPE